MNDAMRSGEQGRLSTVTIVAAVVLILLWIQVAYNYVSKERQSRIDHYVRSESLRINNQADILSINFGRNLGYLAGIPFVVANNPLINNTMKRMFNTAPEEQDTAALKNRWINDLQLADLNRYLHLMARHLDVDLLWVMNNQGYCVLSNNTGQGSPIGSRYSDRHYFLMAEKQRYGRQFAVGRTTHLPGLYYSSDIRDDEGKFLGVAAVKRNISKLTHLIDNGLTLITDELGVVILSTDPALLMKSLPDGRIDEQSEDARRRRYRQESFAKLELHRRPGEAGEELFLLGNDTVPMLMAKRHRPSDDIIIHVFGRLYNIGQIESDGRWMFIVLSATGSLSILLLLGVVLFVARNRQQNSVLQEMNRLLQQQAYTDQLTGCFNRRRWLELGTLGVERVGRYGNPLSLLMLDLDHFKAVNDRFGHSAGDEVLRRFAHMLQQMVRKFDVVGRLGGEEFSILLPQTPLDRALVLAERIRASMQMMKFRFSGQEVTVTVSIGVSEYKSKQPLKDFLQQADDALYEAKRKGRNQVCTAQGERHRVTAKTPR
ncbi:MAG: diguanylate cyclase [Candidatus Thiodiazotropha sp.]